MLLLGLKDGLTSHRPGVSFIGIHRPCIAGALVRWTVIAGQRPLGRQRPGPAQRLYNEPVHLYRGDVQQSDLISSLLTFVSSYTQSNRTNWGMNNEVARSH